LRMLSVRGLLGKALLRVALLREALLRILVWVRVGLHGVAVIELRSEVGLLCALSAIEEWVAGAVRDPYRSDTARVRDDAGDDKHPEPAEENKPAKPAECSDRWEKECDDTICHVENGDDASPGKFKPYGGRKLGKVMLGL
jgi:hypothetical protein